MKFTVTAVCILLLATLISVQGENMMSLINACKKEENCKENLVDILRKQQEPKTHECECAIGCLGQKKELITADNTLNENQLKLMLTKMHIPDDKAPTIISTCLSTTGADKCELAKKLGECIKANS